MRRLRTLWRVGTENEPTVPAQLAARLRDQLNGLEVNGHRLYVTIRTVQDRGPGAAEHRYGPDLVIVLRLDTPSTAVTKGPLVQAKRGGRGGVHLGGEERRRIQVTTISNALRVQCRKMTRLSPSSFIWVYDPAGVRSTTATAVEEVQPGRTRKTVTSVRIDGFMDHLLDCSIGDPRISAHDDATLDRLLDEADARTAVNIQMISSGIAEPSEA